MDDVSICRNLSISANFLLAHDQWISLHHILESRLFFCITGISQQIKRLIKGGDVMINFIKKGGDKNVPFI